MHHITPPRRSFEQGFRLVPRFAFLNDCVDVAPFLGATSMTEAEIEEAHADVLTHLRDRVENRMPAGRYIIYDPNADAEGWMLAGDDPKALYAETERMLADLEEPVVDVPLSPLAAGALDGLPVAARPTIWIVKGETIGLVEGQPAGLTEWQFSDAPPGKRGYSEDYTDLEEGLIANANADFNIDDAELTDAEQAVFNKFTGA